MLMLVAYTAPLTREPLPQPMAVATITQEAALLLKMKPKAVLKAIADKLGLHDTEIMECDTLPLPPKQIALTLGERRG
jgi:hypothetical protein